MRSMTSMPYPSGSHAVGDRSAAPLEISIGTALRVAARRWPHRTALISGEAESARRSRWTYAQLLEAAEQRAWALLIRFGPGDRVGIWAANGPEWIFVEFGAALAGVTLVTINPAYVPAELGYVLRQSGAQGLIHDTEHRGRDLSAVVEQVRADLPDLSTVLAMPNWQRAVGEADPRSLPDVRPDDIAQIQYTSGTTGFPKGAELTHRGLVNNSRSYAVAIGVDETDVWINPMPLFHTAGCGLVTLGALQTGGAHVLPEGFDPERMLTLFEEERGTVSLSVPTMLFRMLEEPSVTHRDLASWRLATLGGAPVPPELVRRAESMLGVKVAIGFGLTEASPYITHTTPDDPHPEWWSTVGRPLPNVEVKVIEPGGGGDVPVGQVGEVCTRSVCVMKGYYRDEAATRASIDRDGWLRTGDLGSLDARGYLRIQGRLKDMIIRGGENIYPREVEDVLFTHPMVAMAAIVGLPDADWGEVVAAFVQLRPGQDIDADGLATYCRERLASYKVPRIWRFVSNFPQTASGKIQKFVLRRQYLSERP